MMKAVLALCLLAAPAASFAPPGGSPLAQRLASTTEEAAEATTTTEAAAGAIPAEASADALESPLTTIPSRTRKPRKPSPLNGWVPDYDAFCYGLPGSLAPMGDFDPLGFSQRGVPLNDVRRYREAEVMHGRVAMVAAVGYLAGEAASPVVWNGAVTGPANDQLAQIPGPLFAVLTLAIGIAETFRAKRGWVEPSSDELFELRATYYPGDLNFDPLGLKPKGADDFATMATKELQNGRLAMIGVAGMCAQELVNHKTIAETADFYSKYFGGADPYN